MKLDRSDIPFMVVGLLITLSIQYAVFHAFTAWSVIGFFLGYCLVYLIANRFLNHDDE